MKQAEVWRKRAEARRAELHAEYEALSAKIKEVALTFTARAGETGKLYGSITTSQIADELNELLGTEIDRRKVGVEPLRQLGEHQVVVRLSGEFQPELTVLIESEEGLAAVEMEEPVVPEAMTEAETEEETETGTEESAEASISDEEPAPESE